MHKDIKESGLADMLKIRPMTSNAELGSFLGKTVRYKPELLTPEFLSSNGTICRDRIFVIRQVQENYHGKPALRGYFEGDTFGRCIDPDHVEIVK